MSRPAVHYRLDGEAEGISRPTACGTPGFNTTDLEAVTCGGCQSSATYRSALAEFNEVVDALSYPKENHPCLTRQTSSPSTSGQAPA